MVKARVRMSGNRLARGGEIVVHCRTDRTLEAGAMHQLQTEIEVRVEMIGIVGIEATPEVGTTATATLPRNGQWTHRSVLWCLFSWFVKLCSDFVDLIFFHPA